MPKLPENIGRFKVVSRIAQGGMGALYLAWDPTLERQIAIKLLRDDNDELRERFSNEARYVARLRHPRIVTIFDVGEHEGQPFIAMEYIQGQTLADIVREETPITVPHKLRLIEELCDGLSFAHRAGIVHRDVKPANMIVEADGSLKILDFGIARNGPGMTRAGMLIGTLNYMSPEQVLGKPVDQRSDIFAVGGVLYELLSYRQAFAGGLDSGILNKILHQPPPPLAAIYPGFDHDIAVIVERALEKDPERRYQDMQAMQRDLQRVRQQLETSQSAEAELMTVRIAPVPVSPAPTPRPPRREQDRAALERRRAAQIEVHLDAARSALAAGNYEAAIAACEEALLLDSAHPTATDLMDKAGAAIDARHAGELLDQAESQFENGALTAAFDLVQQVFALGQSSPRAAELSKAIVQARQTRARERQRLEDGRKAIERARELLDAGSFDEAAKAADHALSIEPDDGNARAIKEGAAAGVERQRLERLDARARQTAGEARRLFAAGDHAAALSLLEQVEPGHDEIQRASEELGAALRAIDLAVEGHLGSASAALAKDEPAAAMTEIRAALVLDPRSARARAMEEQVAGVFRALAEQRELAERRERERQQAMAAMLERAADTPSHAAALGVIREVLELDPTHAEARRSLDLRQAALEREQAAARRREEIQVVYREVEALLDRDDLDRVDEALAAAEDASDARQALEPLRRRLEQAREEIARRELEERRRQERERAVADALARAAAASSHEIAVAAFREVLDLEPAHGPAQEGLERHQAALEQERALAAAIARVTAASSDAAAIAALRDLLALDPDYPDAARQLQDREAALERQQAEARRLRLRQEAIDAGMARAATAGSHEAAIAALRDVLEIEPAHANARRLLGVREAALDDEREAERRRREIEAAREQLETELSRGDLAAAEQALAAAEEIGVAPKTLKPLRRQLQKQQAAAKRASSPETPHIARRTRMYAGAAVAAIVLLTVAYALTSRRAPRPETEAHEAVPAVATAAATPSAPTPSSTTVTTPGVPASAGAPASDKTTTPAPSNAPANTSSTSAEVSAPRNAASSAGVASPAPAVPPAPRPATPAPTVVEPAAEIEARLLPLRLQARRQIDRGDRRLAVDSIMSGLKLRPNDPSLRRMLGQLVRDATGESLAAHRSAVAAGAIAVNSPIYKDATVKEQEGLQLARRRPEQALNALWDAAALYAQAEKLGRSARVREAPSIAQSMPAPVVPTPGPSLPATTRPADPAPTVERRGSAPAPTTVQPSAASLAADEAAVRAVLRTYEQAFSAMNVDAVKRVYPGVNAGTLANNFKQMRALRVEILSPRVSIAGLTAVVACQVRQSFTPAVGSGGQTTVAATFRLQKRGDTWIIVERR